MDFTQIDGDVETYIEGRFEKRFEGSSEPRMIQIPGQPFTIGEGKEKDWSFARLRSYRLVRLVVRRTRRRATRSYPSAAAATESSALNRASLHSLYYTYRYQPTLYLHQYYVLTYITEFHTPANQKVVERPERPEATNISQSPS
ncbi:hypothetical protein V1477_020306 [Vespula maculifrons]|uniref:Uncharacterized protein n=1 Tax=Vespula maculifrons TaxID=7453 RepID=A0ABD2ALJ0_VESMC